LTAQALAGAGILVTRPSHQAAELIEAIEAAGGEPVLFPVLLIDALDPDTVADTRRRLPPADIVIFTSTNAVRYGLPPLLPGLGERARVAAIGPATRRAIEDAGHRVDIRPQGGFDSEHLLAAAALQDVGKRHVWIVRGVGGRELLAETLRQRGANVHYLPVYRRLPQKHSATEIEGLEARWAAGGIHAVIVMSGESLDKLWALLPATAREALRRTPLVTPSRRVIKTIAETLPGSPAILATGPQAADMMRALTHAFASGIRHEPET
jgi:uroporphyrinogen-III synthase